MEALKTAIKHAGGVGALARKLGVRQSVVSNWKAREQVPTERCAAIETATGITCESLRPDLDWTRDAAGRITGYHTPVAPGIQTGDRHA